jgi:hypothetical protein
MDRCRRCGYQLTDDELREREYEALVSRNSAEARPSGEPSEEREPGLF